MFNETFSCRRRTKDLCMLWHEGITGRTAKDVAASYIKAITLCEEKHFEFWTDNCCSQNKNWSLFTILVLAVNSDWGPESISVKYLVKGHTFMGADAVHGLIGKKMKRSATVLTFDDFVLLCQSASKLIQAVELRIQDFY